MRQRICQKVYLKKWVDKGKNCSFFKQYKNLMNLFEMLFDIHLPHNLTKQSSKRGPHIFSFSRKLASSLSSIPNEYIKVFIFISFSLFSYVFPLLSFSFSLRFSNIDSGCYYYQTACRTHYFLCIHVVYIEISIRSA